MKAADNQYERRERMSEEKKDVIREKDKLRKRKGALTKKKKAFSRAQERQNDMLYRRRVRAGMTATEIEYEQVYNLLKQRKSRQSRDGKAHLLDNLKAKKGMRDLKEIGRVFAFMARGKREKDEEVLWWNFWTKGKQFKDILTNKQPEIAAKMLEKENLLKKKDEERKKIEEDLDARGRWKLDCGEYYWTIPDENGHLMSLGEYEAECEANEPKLSPEEIEEKRKKDQEFWKKHDEQLEKWREQERKQDKAEKAKKARDRREQKKEELLKPIDMPVQVEKGDYEKARNETILERHTAMKESGLFSDHELKAMLKTVT